MKILDVAHLARIALSDDEALRYQEQVDQILHYVEQLNRVDVDGIEPTALSSAIFDIVREDAITGTSLSLEAALSNAPATSHDQFRMPKVVE